MSRSLCAPKEPFRTCDCGRCRICKACRLFLVVHTYHRAPKIIVKLLDANAAMVSPGVAAEHFDEPCKVTEATVPGWGARGNPPSDWSSITRSGEDRGGSGAQTLRIYVPTGLDALKYTYLYPN